MSGPSVDLAEARGDQTRAETACRIGAMLRAGVPVPDSQFDEVYPVPVRSISSTFWTPVGVALRAAQLLVNTPGCRVLDVGSGVGKFCVIGALSTTGQFFGIEQREKLVGYARDAAVLMGASSATFTHGLLAAMNPERYDAFYFFNPFEDAGVSSLDRLDDCGERARRSFDDEVRTAQQFLHAAKPGARVVTYNGMGGAIPWSYDLVKHDPIGCGIDLWVKE